MDPGVPMILPKGIVINSTSIYREVASYPNVPAAKICQFWHVYTTTNKKLEDPTARRLENFWWQVWGSDRRHLSGRALARIYETISLGPTFVPLHGPPNRWEGPDVDRSEPLRVKSNDLKVQSLSSSASKPPPSHPILKKARSPFATGRRPTARFASPPELDDDRKENHGQRSMKEPRPAQTQNKTTVLALERSADATRSESRQGRNDVSTRPPTHPSLSAKAAGKQPATTRTASKDFVIKTSRGASRPTMPPAVANSNSLARNTCSLRSPVSTRSMSLTRTDTDNSSTGSIPDSSSIIMARSMTQNGYARKPSTQSLFTSATATTTNVAAQGQIIDQAGSLPASSISDLDQHVRGASLAFRPSATSLVDSRMMPTQPSQAASVPMGRTRSQLTLLLEREKSRVGDKSRFRI
ncbi:hypothetical protein E4U41_003409 [Claviceps citrina]|nr:hypothetical protein E4U41_003409 [Claviceps citrina]